MAEEQSRQIHQAGREVQKGAEHHRHQSILVARPREKAQSEEEAE
jgi:hypothetical protein